MLKHLRTLTRCTAEVVHVDHCTCTSTAQVQTPTYTTGAAQAVHAEHCTSTVTVCTLTSTYLRTVDVSLRLSMPNTVHIHVQCARPSTRAYVQQEHCSGRPRQTLYTYTYSVHAQAHGLTCNRRIAQASNTKHCTRTRTVGTSKHMGVRTIGASLNLPIPTTVQVQVQRGHPRSRIHVQRRPRSGYRCRPLCKYKYSVSAHFYTLAQ